jgi:hypothetical protein
LLRWSDQHKIAVLEHGVGMVKEVKPRWSAVSIVAGSGSCEAAIALKGRRFLGAEAPRIPLAECTCAPSCRCIYRKHSDRRAGPRRAEEHTGMRRVGTSGPERRIGRGRRRTDV